MIFHRLVSSCLGIGYIKKGGGTVASLFCCFVWYFTRAGEMSIGKQVLIFCLLMVLGVWSAGKMEKEWGKDSYRVVLDEVAGMWGTLLFTPFKISYIVTGLILFRFFDIAKPLGIRKTEALKKGWGVMMDDVVAAIYANLVLQLLVLLNAKLL